MRCPCVRTGEDVVILRGTEPVVRLVPAHSPAPQRRFGALAGKDDATDAFFEPLPPEELVAWES